MDRPSVKPPGVNGHVPLEGAGEPVQGAANLFMNCFMAGLGVLFAAGIVLYLIVRHAAPQWPPEGAPPLPSALWVSTGLILVSSITIQLALNAIRGGSSLGLTTGLGFTLILGLVFIASQIASWNALGLGNLDLVEPRIKQYVAVYVFLIVLHAVHVVGGIVPLIVCLSAAARGSYQRFNYQGVTNLVRYWHFLGTIWLILFAVLKLAGSK